MSEAHIVINGQVCSIGESMTIRVAIESYALWLSQDDTKKGMGKIGEAYQARIIDISKKLYPITPDTGEAE